jgi:hypothetical protein
MCGGATRRASTCVAWGEGVACGTMVLVLSGLSEAALSLGGDVGAASVFSGRGRVLYLTRVYDNVYSMSRVPALREHTVSHTLGPWTISKSSRQTRISRSPVLPNYRGCRRALFACFLTRAKGRVRDFAQYAWAMIA